MKPKHNPVKALHGPDLDVLTVDHHMARASTLESFQPPPAHRPGFRVCLYPVVDIWRPGERGSAVWAAVPPKYRTACDWPRPPGHTTQNHRNPSTKASFLFPHLLIVALASPIMYTIVQILFDGSNSACSLQKFEENVPWPANMPRTRYLI